MGTLLLQQPGKVGADVTPILRRKLIRRSVDVLRVTQLASWGGAGLTSPRGERSSGGGVIQVHPVSSSGWGRGWRNGSVLGWEGLGGQSGAQESGGVYGPWKGEAWNPGTPALLGSAVPHHPFCLRVSSHQALSHPTMAAPGAYNGIE